MHTLLLTGDQSRYGVLASAASKVVCSAPLSASMGRPVAKVSLSPLPRGFQLRVHTLDDEPFLALDMPHVTKDIAEDCRTYMKQRFASAGFVVDEASAKA